MSYEAEARAMYERHARHYPDEPWVPGPWRMAPATPGQLSYLHKIAKRRALTGCTAEELALVQRIAAEGHHTSLPLLPSFRPFALEEPLVADHHPRGVRRLAPPPQTRRRRIHVVEDCMARLSRCC